jgi:hypothetical protein
MIILGEILLLFSLRSRSLCTLASDVVNVTPKEYCEGDGIYTTLFASSYFCSDNFPIWTSVNGKQNYKHISIENLPKTNITRQHTHDLDALLIKSINTSLEDYLAFLIYDSKNHSFWFDDGAGILKELSYKVFWSHVNGGNFSYNISLGEEQKVFGGTCTIRGETGRIIDYCYRPLEGSRESWVIVGDFILGKKVDNHILIKRKWQDSFWHFEDMILSL